MELLSVKSDSKTKKFSFNIDADLYEKFEGLQKKADENGIEIKVDVYFKKSFAAFVKKIEKGLDAKISATKNGR